MYMSTMVHLTHPSPMAKIMTCEQLTRGVWDGETTVQTG